MSQNSSPPALNQQNHTFKVCIGLLSLHLAILEERIPDHIADEDKKDDGYEHFRKEVIEYGLDLYMTTPNMAPDIIMGNVIMINS